MRGFDQQPDQVAEDEKSGQDPEQVQLKRGNQGGDSLRPALEG